MGGPGSGVAVGGVLSLIILAPPLALRVMDSFYRLSSPWFFSLFLLEGGPPPFYPQSLQGTPLGLSQVHISLPMPLLTKGIPLSTGLHDPDDIPFPPQMIRWPQDSPSVLPVALATPAQRNPVPSWLPADSKTLYQQASKPSQLRTPCIMPIPHTGFQPIAHMPVYPCGALGVFRWRHQPPPV